MAFPELSPEYDAASRPPVAIIGSRGRMGSMLAAMLTNAGWTVHGFDTATADRQEAKASIVQRSRIILLCVPVASLRDCLADLTPHLNADHLLMDVTSVKALPLRWMEEAFSGAVIGSHPMFGPVHRPEDKRVALVRGTNATADDCALAARLFESLECTVFWSGAREHDAGVAISQSLNFTVSAAFFAAVARHKGIEPYLTPSFRRHMEAARNHLTKDREMFVKFSAMNPEFPAAIEAFNKAMAEAASGRLAHIAEEASIWYHNPQSTK